MSTTDMDIRPTAAGSPGVASRIALWGFVVLGIAVRLREYLFCRSLWLDESMLALNIIRRSPAQLLKPLDYNQGAPIGFLWLEKLVVHWFGSGEMALRLVPFLAGVGAIFLFVIVARRFLTPMEVSIAAGLFCICSTLAYYSTETKQYSSDVAIVTLLYLVSGPLLEGEFGILETIGFAAAGALAVWFSHPAAFIIAGLGLGSLWMSVRRNDRRSLVKISCLIAIWFGSFVVCYLVSLRGLSHNRALLEYWSGDFAPFPSSLSNIIWYVHSTFGIFLYPVGLTFTGIAAAAAVLGAIEIFKVNQGRFILLLLPIGLTLLASWLRRYPFQGRLLLFIVPSLILLIAAGLGSLHRRTRESLPLLGPLLIGLLFLHPLVNIRGVLMKPYGMEEMRPVLEYAKKHVSEGDTLYCYYSSEPPLEYYAARGLDLPVTKIVGVESRQDWKLYRQDLEKVRGKQRVWFLFSHVWSSSGADEELLYVDYLDSMGKRLDALREPGASIYLYDLSAAQVVPVSESKTTAGILNERSSQ